MKRQASFARGLGALLGAVAISTTASAEVISFRNGSNNALVTNYQGTTDTLLNSTAASAHQGYGALTVVLTGKETMAATGEVTYRTPLFRFDLSAMQGQYASINSATLTLYQRETSVQFPDFEMALYEVSAANGGWVEGTSSSAGTGVAGNPDWFHLNHDTQTWAGSPGLQTPGTDYVTPAIGTATFTAGLAGTTDRQGAPYAFTLPVDMVIDWINGDNPGVLVHKTDLSTDGLAQFGSSEFATASSRPLLTIDYTVPEPAGLPLLALAALALRRRRLQK